MEWFEAILLGLLQGLTEFLPVSSSGHLQIGKELLGIDTSGDLVFEVVVHAATVLSTIVVFIKQIWELLKSLFVKDGLFRSIAHPSKFNDGTDYVLKILLSMIPVFIVGMFFKDAVEGLFGSSIHVVAGALLVTAALLLLSDNAGKIFGCCCRRRKCAEADAVSCKGSEPAKTTDKCAEATEAVETGAKGRRNGISYWQAFVVGLGQAIAVIPGLSRSGTTIATGLLCGVKRDVVAQFSFLMVLIPIIGEAFLEIVGGDMASSTVGALPLVLGFISAFVAGLFACRVMIALVKKTKLGWFALYCAVVAVLIFVFA
ncbi:MAG: undecaprenyl-diphosphate phosphatase [Bacteroidales bacterium]|nr:undecaprenyl-diphosphate phosphatase [Bacteroidales bacterium]